MLINKRFTTSKRFSFMLAVALLVNLAIPVMAASKNVNVNEPDIIVEVYVNNFDEEYIENITFDDGTRIGDYSYVIQFAKTPRAYALGNYFDFAAWITRDDGLTLSLDPTDTVRKSSSLAETAWNCLASEDNGFGANPNFYNNETILRWQYNCHFDFAKNKDRWNLEPWRTASTYIEVVVNKCNP